MSRLVDEREKRQHERITIRFPVEARPHDGTDPVRGISVNLSASGILATLPRELPLGDEVDLVLELPGEEESVTFRGLPLRSGPSPAQRPHFRVAFHFIQPDEEDVRRLRRIIYEK